MKLYKNVKIVGAVALVMAGTGLLKPVEAATVTVDGQRLQTAVDPIQRNGRTLVPLRDIFEALGATVNWNQSTQGIAANRGNTNINLRIGDRRAQVNGKQVWLDQAATIYHGSTMVPMRFVAESLGARVDWNNATEVASITTGGHAVAAARTITVPAGAIVRVKLDSALNSATARVGDQFNSTIESQTAGDSEFPAGSRLIGTINDAKSKDGDQPGMLDLTFQSVVLPDGTRYPLQGSLTSLDNASIDTSTPGRTMGKAGKAGKNKLVMVGIGAGVGLVLGKVLKTNSTITTLLGGLAGYLLGNKSGSTDAADAALPAGTQLGVRLDRDVAYADSSDYYRLRSAYMTK
jgi:hypothetical protein